MKIIGKRNGRTIPHFFCLAVVLGAIIVVIVVGLKLSTPDETQVLMKFANSSDVQMSNNETVKSNLTSS